MTEKANTPQSNGNEQEIRIVGIDTEHVGVPRNDGTRGSALYQVPIKLSRTPSAEWGRLLVQNWDHPTSYTSMHRPGIARVIGDCIVLNGTTVEEIAEYHNKVLAAAVKAANDQEKTLIERRAQAEEAERARISAHKEDVARRAAKIKFEG